MSSVPLTPTETVSKFLANTTDEAIVRSVVATDATYISLNFSSPDLKKIMPWAGTSTGAQAFIDTFRGVNAFWTTQLFEINEIFAQKERVAVFGNFKLTSRTLNKTITSPYSILAKVKDGKIFHFMFMEDTFTTTSAFRITSSIKYHSNPDEKPFLI